jgi:hypothetical protein
MSKIQTKKCPEVHLIEAYVTNSISSTEQNEIFRHIESCRKCQAIAAELQQFYAIFMEEDRKPVNSSVFKIVHDIEGKMITLAGILLHPKNQGEKLPHLSYHSEIVFSTDKQSDSIDVEDLECIPIYDNEIFFRAVQEVSNNETTLYFFAHHEKLYRNVRFKIQSIEQQFSTDTIGMVKVGRLDLTDLDNQEIIIFPNP